MKTFSAYILAGGKSSRMGTDKGLQLLNETPLIAYVIDNLKKVTKDISIITSNNDYEIFSLTIVKDLIPNKGPASGIDTALQHSKENWIFISSCDMPFIDSKSILKLFSFANEHEIIVVQNKEMVEPMFCFYHKNCKNKWRTLLENGTLKLSEFYTHFDTKYIDAELFLKKNKYIFTNINTSQNLIDVALWMKK